MNEPTYDELLNDIRWRARAWRDDEISALRHAQDDDAAKCRLRAAVLEQLHADLLLKRAA